MDHYEEIVGKVNVLNISGGVWRGGGVICHVKHTEITLGDNHCQKTNKSKAMHSSLWQQRWICVRE